MRGAPGHFTAVVSSTLYSTADAEDRACDWGTGLPLKASLLGKMSRLEVHHIFPKSQLYKCEWKYKRRQVNALANFCFLTKDTNLDISDRLPSVYFPEVEEAHPGALASQWIPMDPELWRVENFRDFLEARKKLLAAEVNQRMEELLHGDTRWLTGPKAAVPAPAAVVGGISSEEEEAQLEACPERLDGGAGASPWHVVLRLRRHGDGGTESGVRPGLARRHSGGLSQPVVVLLNEGAETIAIASQAGFRCFTTAAEFSGTFRRSGCPRTAA